MSDNQVELTEKIIQVNRVAKVVKGGRRFSFNALVVVGDGNGTIGIGMGKALEVPDALRKATQQAKRSLFKVPNYKGTVPHAIDGRHGASSVLLMPASDGTGVIAGGAVRSILESAGLRNVLTKSIGTNNSHNVTYATIKGLQNLQSFSDYRKKLK